MASVYDLKPKFQNLLRPICRTLARLEITANQVTISALLLSIGTGAVIYTQRTEPLILLSLPIVLFIRMALNAIDGMLAREHNMKTPFGAVLNELGDAISDTAIYLPLAFVDSFEPVPIVLIVILAVMSEMTGIIGVQIGASRRYEGPMGKSDRAFWFSTIAVVLGFGVKAEPWLSPVLGVMIAMLILTIVNRIKMALKELHDEPA